MNHWRERIGRAPRARLGGARVALVVMLVAAAGTACSSDSTGPGGGGAFGNIGGLLGGYTGTGFSSFGQKLDPQFIYLYFNDAVAEGPWNCDTDGYCGLGGLRNTFGALVEADSFLFVSTANVIHNGADRVVRNSGIQSQPITIANPAQYTAVRVSFQFVFASARTNTAHNDSAIVRLKAGTDSVTIFKVTAADMQAGGKYPPRSGGCGSASIIAGRAITYPTCTGWVSTTVGISAYKARTFVLQFIAAEAGQSATDHTDEPVAFLFRKVAIEGAK